MFTFCFGAGFCLPHTSRQAPRHILQTGAQGGHRKTTAFNTDTMEIKIGISGELVRSAVRR